MIVSAYLRILLQSGCLPSIETYLIRIRILSKTIGIIDNYLSLERPYKIRRQLF